MQQFLQYAFAARVLYGDMQLVTYAIGPGISAETNGQALHRS